MCYQKCFWEGFRLIWIGNWGFAFLLHFHCTLSQSFHILECEMITLFLPYFTLFTYFTLFLPYFSPFIHFLLALSVFLSHGSVYSNHCTYIQLLTHLFLILCGTYFAMKILIDTFIAVILCFYNWKDNIPFLLYNIRGFFCYCYPSKL